MKILSLEPVRREVRRLQETWSPVAVILAYHRIHEGLDDPQRLMIRPDCFAEQMAVLQEMTQPVALPDLLAQLRTQPRDAKPLSVVTLDDGYADNLLCALPILRRFDVPATVFVASDAINRTREFWWDELERVLLSSEHPDVLRLRLGAEDCEWSFEADGAAPREPWDVYDPPRRVAQQAYLKIASHLMFCPPEEQDELLSDLFAWAGAERMARDGFRTLTGPEVAELAADPLISIGAHTVSHANLSVLDPAAQTTEIGGSQACLERQTGRSVRTFSYPYGRVEDYTHSTLRILRKSGFGAACTTVPRLVHRWSDPLQLPRFTVGNWSGERFRQKLTDYLSGSA